MHDIKIETEIITQCHANRKVY